MTDTQHVPKSPRQKVLKSIRLRPWLYDRVMERCEREDLTFPEAVDHALTAWVGEDEATDQ